jgi:hypothetical protein
VYHAVARQKESTMKPHLAFIFPGLVAIGAMTGPTAALAVMPCDDATPTNSWNQPVAFSTHAEAGRWVGFRKKLALLGLRKEGLDMQAADGGKLTEAHRSYLQSKLDAIQSGHY